MLLSAVSVLVVAQSSSEVPEGLMNNPVLCSKSHLCCTWKHRSASEADIFDSDLKEQCLNTTADKQLYSQNTHAP